MSLSPDTDGAKAPVHLRPYAREDLPAIFALDEICFAPPFRFSLAMMRRFAEAPNAVNVIADGGGSIAGFCIAHVERAADELLGYIVTLDVAPGERRRGLAQSLIEDVEAQAHAAGCVAMVLHVSVENAGAIRFYERMGYVHWRPAPGFYGRGRDAWVYRKSLTASSTSPVST